MENIDEILKKAIVNNNITFLEENRKNYDINHRFSDEDNDTLLLYAISDKWSETYIFFLNNGANINLTNDEGEGIIHSIIYSGISTRLIDVLNKKPEAMKLVNAQTKDGVSPLLLSVLLERYDIFNILLDLKVDIDLADNECNTPIHMSCFLGYEEMVFKLVEKGANLHLKTQKGNYPLALAINGDHDRIVRYLFNKIYM